MDQHFTCTADARVAPDQHAEICAGFLAHLRQTYPKVVFTPAADAPAGAGLRVHLLRASRSAATLQLRWTDATGRVTTGPEAGLSVMDRDMSALMLEKLFQRALADTPMP